MSSCAWFVMEDFKVVSIIENRLVPPENTVVTSHLTPMMENLNVISKGMDVDSLCASAVMHTIMISIEPDEAGL